MSFYHQNAITTVTLVVLNLAQQNYNVQSNTTYVILKTILSGNQLVAWC